jgi:outer membrane receptor protein involved in Fe transport
VTGAFGQTRTQHDLNRDLPRADITDFSATSSYKPPTSFGYRGWLLLFTPDWPGGVPTNLAEALEPGRAYIANPFTFPAVYHEVPSETKFVTRQMIFAPGDTAMVVSPQGWCQEGYYDLSGTFWLGEGGRQWMTSNAVQTAVRGDVTHVIGEHTIKAGAEYLLADLEYHVEEKARVFGSRHGCDLRDYGGKYSDARPNVLGIFLQDKFESHGMIMNFGVRAERFDGGGPVFMPDMMFDDRFFSVAQGKFWFDSLLVTHGWDVADPAWGGLPGSPGEAWTKFVANGVPEKYPMPWEVSAVLPQRDARGYWEITPRFGISHPVSERTKFFFNYGIFYSMAKPAQMYTYGAHNGQVGAAGRIEQMYNADLRPARTTSYEVGFEHVFPFAFVFKTTGYAKANVDQVTVIGVEGTGDGYQMYRNANYQDIRGLEMKLSRSSRFVNAWATYQRIATRSGQTGLSVLSKNIVASTFYTPLVVTNAPADNVAVSVRVGTPTEWGLVSGGWGVNVIGRYSENTGEVIYNPNAQPRRELPPEWIMRGRDYWGADAKLTKEVAIGRQRRVSIYLDITNLFNRKYLNGTYLNGNDYLQYVVDRRSEGEKSLRVGDPSTWDALTKPYRIKKADGTYSAWKAPISPRTDWLMCLSPRAYRAGIRFDL